MGFYLFLAIFPFLLGFCYPRLNTSNNQKKQYYFLCGIIFLIIMGLRHYSLGSTDTLNYYNAMVRAIESDSWRSYFNESYFETGAQFLIFVLSRFFANAQWLLIITSLFYIVSIFYFVNFNSNDIPLSISLYITLGLFTFHLQGMRQSIAMCICLFAYEQAKRKHLLKFIILVVFAITFHQTAIVFFPIYILCQWNFSKKNIFIVIFGSMLFIVFAEQISVLANTLFDRSFVSTTQGGGYVTLAIHIIILMIALLVQLKITSNENISLLYIVIMATSCYIFRYFGTSMAVRVSYYFTFAQISILPKITYFITKSQRNILRILIFLFTLVFYIYHLKINGSDFLPYQFFWVN